MSSLHHFPASIQIASEDSSMRIIDTLAEMTETARGWLLNGRVGCVVITGSVQARHEILVRSARAHCEICVVCILRASQSLEPSEASTYTSWIFQPEFSWLKSTGTDVVFLPAWQDLFPADFVTYVHPSLQWLGILQASQEHTFATVFLKLFHLIHPDVFYLSQSDARQVSLLRQLVRDLNLDVEISLPTLVREQSALAIITPVVHLSREEEDAVSFVYESLLLAKVMIEHGVRNVEALKGAIQEYLAATNIIQVQELSITHVDTPNLLQQDVVLGSLLEIRAQVGTLSLTDNITWLYDGNWLM